MRRTCGKSFGLFTWRQNCSCCGNSFCSACLKQTRPLATLGHETPVPVCAICVPIIDRFDREQGRKDDAKSLTAQTPLWRWFQLSFKCGLWTVSCIRYPTRFGSVSSVAYWESVCSQQQ